MTCIDKIYAFLNDEKENRICTDISEEACQKAPSNYFLLSISHILTSLGDTLSNPKTVLAWIMSYVNAPVFLISFIVPIRESGSMLPQIFIASYVRKKAIRKWVWVVGSIFQFFSIVAIGVVALYFEEAQAGWLIILFLITFSLSRAFCSVTSKDVEGKCIPKTRRGKLKGFTGAISGILVLIAGIFMILQKGNDPGISFYVDILFFAASMWIFAALTYSFIKEFSGETDSSKSSWKDVFSRLMLVKRDLPFRKFILARSLLLCSALTAPFYVILAQQELGEAPFLLGLFIIANGVASILSAPFWGRMADHSSKGVMVYGAVITSVLGIVFFMIMTWSPLLRSQYWLYPISYFILGIAHSGVRLGRKTYIVDLATGNQRTDYVSVSNTLIGIILLITGGVSALASIFSVEGIILILSLFGVAGAFVSSHLPEVES